MRQHRENRRTSHKVRQSRTGNQELCALTDIRSLRVVVIKCDGDDQSLGCWQEEGSGRRWTKDAHIGLDGRHKHRELHCAARWLQLKTHAAILEMIQEVGDTGFTTKQQLCPGTHLLIGGFKHSPGVHTSNITLDTIRQPIFSVNLESKIKILKCFVINTSRIIMYSNFINRTTCSHILESFLSPYTWYL